MFKRELEYFFAALRFFTRLPVPDWVGHSEEQLDRATRYYPLVGMLVGVIGASVTVLCNVVLPQSIAVILGMVSTLLVTGAFHEDGFADMVDGFGGGYGKERILEIMKDSRVGSYGVIAVSLLLLIKYTALRNIADMDGMYVLCPVLVAGHTLSRLASSSLIACMAYVREDASAKSKPMGKAMHANELLVAAGTTLIPVVALWFIVPQSASLLWSLALVVVVTIMAGRYFQRHIGGYTGDCLGAAQQLAEVAFYLGLLCRFS